MHEIGTTHWNRSLVFISERTVILLLTETAYQLELARDLPQCVVPAQSGNHLCVKCLTRKETNMLKVFLSRSSSSQAISGYFVGFTLMPIFVFLLYLLRAFIVDQATKYLPLFPLTKNLEPYPFTDFSSIAIPFILLIATYGSLSRKCPVFAIAAMGLHITTSLVISAILMYIIMYC